jgi:hypothetical protein
VYRSQEGRVVVIPQHGVVKRGTLASILRQAGLTPAEFLNFSTRERLSPTVRFTVLTDLLTTVVDNLGLRRRPEVG